MTENAEMITILGHTAGGKTSIAAHVAFRLDGEVISADSRQVYRGMTIGTGKDYADYIVKGTRVPYHLVDIVEAGYEYNVYEFQRDFVRTYQEVRNRNKLPVMCGGTGMYIESVLRRYHMVNVPVNQELREELNGKDTDTLTRILQQYTALHNQTDTTSKKRAIRAIEIAEYMKRHGEKVPGVPRIRSLNIGIAYDRDTRRSRITSRLEQRIREGMIEEAEELIRGGMTYAQLEYYGLEYKFLAGYLKGALNRDEMIAGLNTAIHRFAKRQMTYFRGMERRGTKIHWIAGSVPLEEKVEQVIGLYNRTI